MLRPLILAATAGALLMAGCGDDDDSSDPAAGVSETATATTAAEPPARTTSATGTTVKVADSEFGQILYDDSDQAIYLFDKESSSKSECYGACAEAWPPVLTEGQPQAGAGLKANLLGTTQRDDGSAQVTYNGHPLYYYGHESPGEVTCHNVEEFGGLWLVVDSAGNAV